MAGDHVGTEQAGQIESHLHAMNAREAGGGTLDYPQVTGFNGTFHSALYNSGTAGGNETRPVNTNRMLIIKAY